MDPNANLEEQRRLAARILSDLADEDMTTADKEDSLATHAPRLSELVRELDEWITKGGFLPTAWSTRTFGGGA